MASFILPAISGLAGLFGGGTQQKQATQQTTNATNTTNGSTSSSTNPNFSPLQNQLINLFTSQAMNQANQPVDLSGYKASGLQTINDQQNAASKATSNMLAARGLSFSPAAATTQIQSNNNFMNQKGQFLNSLPLLQRQLQQQNIQGLLGAFSAIPTGQSSSGSTNQTQTTNGTTTGNGAISGNPLAGLFGGVGTGLAASLPMLFGGGGGNSSPTMYGVNDESLGGS